MSLRSMKLQLLKAKAQAIDGSVKSWAKVIVTQLQLEEAAKKNNVMLNDKAAEIRYRRTYANK